jgi:hypothetical protein
VRHLVTTTAHQVSLSPPSKAARWLLVAVEVIVAVNAIGGAVYGLAGAKDVPRDWLEGTPFDSYVVPSLILLVGVGGGMTVAATALLMRHRRAPEAAMVAGLVLMGWIAVQVLLIGPNGGLSWLQPTMFAAALLVAALGWRLRRAETPSRRPDSAGDDDSR